VEASEAREALLTAALAEASEVLDGSVMSGPVLSSGRALFDVALLHVIRATGLEGHSDRRHEQTAQMAMYDCLRRPHRLVTEVRKSVGEITREAGGRRYDICTTTQPGQ
jgi:hypothetical protein